MLQAIVILVAVFLVISVTDSFTINSHRDTGRGRVVLHRGSSVFLQTVLQQQRDELLVLLRASISVSEATDILAEWDQLNNPDRIVDGAEEGRNKDELRRNLPDAMRLLANEAAQERSRDTTKGRCMLGICASSPAEGIATLKSWVSSLQLPRGLLHGYDKDGIPLELEGGVYIKYNTGGLLTFAAIRKSGLGFDALWKPGDALLEPYDGIYRGVYFQVELMDGQFRQFLVPLDIFDNESKAHD